MFFWKLTVQYFVYVCPSDWYRVLNSTQQVIIIRK